MCVLPHFQPIYVSETLFLSHLSVTSPIRNPAALLDFCRFVTDLPRARLPFMTVEIPRHAAALVCLVLSLVLTACNSDVRSDTENAQSANDGQTPVTGQTVDTNQASTDNQTDDSSTQTDDSSTQPDESSTQPDNNTTVSPDDFSVSLSSTTVDITEGGGEIELPVSVTRGSGFTDDLTLSVSAASEVDASFLTQSFSDASLDAAEQSSTLQLELAIAPAPIQPQTRTLFITATDSAGQSSSAQLNLQVQPTSASDVYLLIGQSNMVGISEEDAKLSAAGEPDAPVDRIRQLNVTFNDEDNFSVARDFTDPEKLFNNGDPLTVALDPLHSGLEGDGTKSGTRIGMGLSFAKRALQDTTAEIYLVPAAWSDTGFCKRETNPVDGLGWNATEKDNDALSGTLLYDRAVARANAALTQSNGILRGILWHQGEADSDDEDCAIVYGDNLKEMVEALRTNIQADARGSAARGADADVPFIVGTMSKAGGQAPFSDTKLIVDGALRNVGSDIAYADFVNSDDLVLPAFACGGGSCIHFGADALREMGARYYEQLRSVLP